MLKNNLKWAKKNIPQDLKIWKELISEVDWKDVGKKLKKDFEATKERITDEVKAVAAMSVSERVDLLVNGEKHLGRLYQTGKIAFTRREWKGVEGTARDFVGWLKIWGTMSAMVMKDPISIAEGLFEYRWFSSYLALPAFADRNNLGLRGPHVTMANELFLPMFRYGADAIATLLRADERLGNDPKIREKLLLFDEMTMSQMMAGFPNLEGMPYQLMPVFMVSEIDQLICIPYIDAVESFGLPSDTCPVPTSECGAAIMDALPHCGLGFISTSTPCDGSDMATSYQDRRFKMPTYPLTLPVRYDDEDTVDCGAEDMKRCIKWVEDLTGEKWDWDHYFEVIRRFNEQTNYEMHKWEINKTPYPQVIGSAYELFRKWSYEMDGGLYPGTHKTFKKIDKMMDRAYEKRMQPYRAPIRHRAIVWSCPAHYYANFSNWLQNCWGIGVLVEMEDLNFTKMLNTEDKEEAIRDLTRLYERMVMRKHTNGGHVHVLEELWKQVEEFKVDIVIMYQHVCCKTMSGLQGLFDEQAREKGVHLIWVEHDLMDPRTVSRRDMRSKVNNYMVNVFQEEPLDPSLVEFEDDAVSYTHLRAHETVTFGGCDVGSTYTKAVIVDENGKIMAHTTIRSKINSEVSAQIAMEEVISQIPELDNAQNLAYLIGTGYGRNKVPFADENISEISCHAMGVHVTDPTVKAIIDIGGQDVKGISIDTDGTVKNFAMNDKCAAGTGRFFEAMARSFEMSLTDFSNLSLTAKNVIPITAQCTVFAESEVITLVGEGKPMDEIAAGIQMAVAKRCFVMAKKAGATTAITLTGGCAKNAGLKNAIEHVLKLKVIDLPIDPQLMGALGAAEYARQKGQAKS